MIRRRKELFVDWKKVKTEYITDESSSYRKLAKKYNISLGSLCDRAKREKWADAKKQRYDETVTKYVEAVEDKKIDRLKRIQDISDRLLDKIEKSIEEINLLDKQGLKWLTGAIKDIKEIQGIKSEIDIREQEARIENLRKQAKQEDISREINIVFSDDIKEYTK